LLNPSVQLIAVGSDLGELRADAVELRVQVPHVGAHCAANAVYGPTERST
jgi:hypothetical protein